MLHILNILQAIVAGVLLVPVVAFCGECVLSLFSKRRRPRAVVTPRPPVAVLMPAHNEEMGIAASIATILPQLHEQDRLIVVADNCTDLTAAVARAAGAFVIERWHNDLRGKGYALDFGVRFLEKDPPKVVIVMDSDCSAETGMIDELTQQVLATNRPAQAIYLMEHPKNPGPKDLVSALAFMVKNQVRPTGLERIGMPCLLTGTGMGFPWEAIRDAKMATGNIVEDMQLGVDLTASRQPPRLCEAARATGRLPENLDAMMAQRRRWEHGHMRTLLTQVPRLAGISLKQFKLGPAFLALDLAVPPLSLLVAVVGATVILTSIVAICGGSIVPTVLLAGGLLAIGLCVMAAWAKFARNTLPLKALIAAPFYLLWKFPIYVTFFIKPQLQWNRTDRSTGRQVQVSRRKGRRDPVRTTWRPACPEIRLNNVSVSAVTEAQCIETILAQLEDGHGGVVITPNLDHLRRCARDSEYATMVNAADLVVADGMPLVWASRLQGTPLPERVAGSDLISSLSAAAAQRGRSIFLLGGAPGAAEDAAKVLRERYPAIKIVGVHCPPIGFEDNAEVMPGLLDALRAASPNIVYVALGSPKQEKLISALRDKLPKTWWMGVGYSFSFLAGHTSRAPMWMQSYGLEWVHRLMNDPGRLAKRYLVDCLPFAASLMGGAAIKGISHWMSTTPASRALMASATQTMPQETTTEEAEAAVVNEPAHAVVGAADEKPSPQLVYRSFLSGFSTRGLSNRINSARPDRRVRPIESGSLRNLKAIVLLSGSIRPSPLSMAIGRSILDLPLEDSRSLLLHWHDQARDLQRSMAIPKLPFIVMVDRASPIPTPPPRHAHVPMRIQRDHSAYRGTGGVLHDLAADYEDDDLLLVANAAQVLIRPLPDLVAELAESKADVSFISPRDGTPSGMMLVRCSALRMIAKAGYVDFKEQAIPLIAKRFDVTPVHQGLPALLPVRSLDEYLAAVQHRHLLKIGAPVSVDPLGEDERPTFCIIEPGAIVDPAAQIHDAVVLRNSRVDANAVVVRSVVCPGGVLYSGATAVDQIVFNEVAA